MFKSLMYLLILICFSTFAHSQNGSINANPINCTISPGEQNCSATLDWNSTGATKVCVWRLGPGLTPAKFACATAGTQIYPYVSANGRTLELRHGSLTYSSSQLLDSIHVTGLPATGSISANNCQLETGQSTCSTDVTWSSNDVSDVCVWRLGPGLTPAKFACLPSGSQSYSYVDVTGKSLELRYGSQNYSNSILLDSITVYAANPGPPSGTIAAENCILSLSQNSCNIDVDWNTSNAFEVCVWESGPGISDTKIACQSSGNQLVSVGLTERTFELRYDSSSSDINNSTLLDAVTVRAFDLATEVQNAQDGDKVRLPQGTHILTDTLLINKDIELIGADNSNANATKIVMQACPEDPRCGGDMTLVRFQGTQSNPLNNVKIKHITLIGEGMEYEALALSSSSLRNPTDGALLRFHYANNVRVKNIVIDNSIRMNLNFFQSNNILIKDSTFKRAGYAIFENPKQSPSIYSGASQHIRTFESSNINVTQNTFIGRNNGPRGDGSADFYDSSGITVFNNHFQNTGASSIYLVNSNTVTVDSNLIENPNENGIDIVDGSSDITIKNNIVCGSNFHPGIVSPGLFHDGISSGSTCPTRVRVENNNTFSDNCSAPMNVDRWAVRPPPVNSFGIDVIIPCPAHNNWDGVCFTDSSEYEFTTSNPLECAYN